MAVLTLPVSESTNDASARTKIIEATKRTLAHMIPMHQIGTLSNMGRSPALADILECIQFGSTWKIAEDSNILTQHFPEQGETPACPIVPLAAMMGLYALKYRRRSFRCEVKGPIFPGDQIDTSEESIFLPGDKRTNLVEFSRLSFIDEEDRGKKLQIPEDTQLNPLEKISLPHGPDFRFVRYAKADANNEYFLGGYTVGDAAFLNQEGNFDAVLLPEVAAQVGAAIGATIIPEGHIFVYKGGIFNFADNTNISVGDTIKVTGKATTKDLATGKMSFEFVARRASDSEPMLWGQVVAESIEYSRLVRGCDVAKRRRKK